MMFYSVYHFRLKQAKHGREKTEDSCMNGNLIIMNLQVFSPLPPNDIMMPSTFLRYRPISSGPPLADHRPDDDSPPRKTWKTTILPKTVFLPGGPPS